MSIQDTDETEYYVSLDLGSESMAAYYEEASSGKGGMVDLQALGHILGGNDCEYLLDDGVVSPRLRTIIALEGGRQESILPAAHAILDLIQDKTATPSTSLFEYFRPVDAVPLNVMPNPKVPFQYGSENIIPTVKLKGSTAEHRYSPEHLLQHITVQVIRNFVCGSPQLRDVSPAKIHLILTVPNVYSLTHAESIRQFVEQHSAVGKVDILYESDALAYFAAKNHDGNDSDDLRRFKTYFQASRPPKRIATIDVGRGTTDLSLIELRRPTPPAQNGLHYVLARPGNCEGGNRLTYLFVEYYNDVLKAFLAKNNLAARFDFLSCWKQDQTYQYKVNQKLEALIDKVKQAVGSNYQISKTLPQAELLCTLFDELKGYITGLSADPNLLKRYREDFVRTMTLPAKLRAKPHVLIGLFRRSGAFGRIIKSWMVRHQSVFSRESPAGADPSQPGPERAKAESIARGPTAEKYRKSDERLWRLRADIENYVRFKIVDLVNELRDYVAIREREGTGQNSKKSRRAVFDDKTFVLVAGQASQFRPLHKELEREIGRTTFVKTNVLSMTGFQAKEACCKGAVAFLRSRNKLGNSGHLFGQYGLEALVPQDETQQYARIATDKLMTGEPVEIQIPSETDYRLIYSPRLRHKPVLNDGNTALIMVIPKARGKITIRYDLAGKQLLVNNKPVRLASFGDVSDDIYPKVWPNCCRTESQARSPESFRSTVGRRQVVIGTQA